MHVNTKGRTPPPSVSVLSLTCNLVSQRGGNKPTTAQNTKPRTILRLKREGETGRQKKIHNKELHNLHRSPDIIRVIQRRTTVEAGHGTSTGRTEMHQFCGGKDLKETDHLKNLANNV